MTFMLRIYRKRLNLRTFNCHSREISSKFIVMTLHIICNTAIQHYLQKIKKSKNYIMYI